METENLSQGLQIVGVGVGGVFVNLFVLMFALYGVGLIFGKKKPAKGSKPPAAKKKPAKSAGQKAGAQASDEKSREPVKKTPE